MNNIIKRVALAFFILFSYGCDSQIKKDNMSRMISDAKTRIDLDGKAGDYDSMNEEDRRALIKKYVNGVSFDHVEAVGDIKGDITEKQ